MKNIYLLVLLLSVIFSSCKDKRSEYIPMNNMLNPHNTEVDVNKPYYQGIVLEKLEAGAYSYLKIDEFIEGHKDTDSHNHKFWIAVNKSPAKVGDEVRFQKELVTKDFKSEVLKKTFEHLMFASNLQYRVKK